MRHNVEVEVRNSADSVIRVTRLTFRTMLGNLILGHRPMILIPGETVESVRITEKK